MKRIHHDLLAWQEALALVTLIYRATATFRKKCTDSPVK